MAAEGWGPASVTPEAPFARIGHQVINVTMDVAYINSEMNRKGVDRFYPNVPLKGIPGAVPTRKAIEDHKLLRQMSAEDGAMLFVMREGTTNRRYKKSGADSSDVCIPCFSSLVGLHRINKPAGEIIFAHETQDAEALEWEHKLNFIGIALPPAANQENDSNFIGVTSGNTSIRITGDRDVNAGQLLAFRVPRPYEFSMGLFKDETNPVAWVVPVDRANWDLNQRARFVSTAQRHFAIAPAVANPREKKMIVRLGIACLMAMYPDGDGAAVTLGTRRERMRKVITQYMFKLDEFDVAVVQIVIAAITSGPRASVVANLAAEQQRIANITTSVDALREIFMDFALDQLPAIRNVISVHDHPIFGKALESGKAGHSIFARIGYIGS